jgi:ribosomal protein S18 acetylase RimI-like enzyme
MENNKIAIVQDCGGVHWREIPRLLKLAGMAYRTAAIHRKAFEKSFAVVFLYDRKKLVGFGRAISDGQYQSAIYDVVVSSEYQGRGLGLRIVRTLLRRLPKKGNVILYASPGKEGFYEKLNFRMMKTGMALFENAEIMKFRGFVE